MFMHFPEHVCCVMIGCHASLLFYYSLGNVTFLFYGIRGGVVHDKASNRIKADVRIRNGGHTAVCG